MMKKVKKEEEEERTPQNEISLDVDSIFALSCSTDVA
jgi:hypothetical protein